MSTRTARVFAPALAFALALAALPSAAEEAMPCHGQAATAAAASGPEASLSAVSLPALTLTDQQGRAVDVRSLLSGRWVALNFVFTRCTTICPPMGANFGKLARELGERLGRDVELVSISIDPAVDTPERLRAWREKFWPGEGWTLLTGAKPQVDRLLRAFGVPAGDPSAHSPLLFVGRGEGASWQRLYGMTPPAEVVAALDRLALHTDEDDRANKVEAGRAYFTDVVLIDHEGHEQRLWSDLIQDKTVVISPFFTHCNGVCPKLAASLGKIQEGLGERVGKDVLILSITVDPTRDTPEQVAQYARDVQPKAGWLFLSGAKANVDLALKRLGYYVDQPEAHTNLMIVGNERTGLWKKAFGLAPAAELISVVRSVMEDQG